MKKFVIALFCLATSSAFAAAPVALGRTLKDLPGFPLATRVHSINRPLFRSLQVSPVETYIVAKSLVFGGRTKDAKIIHEEGNGLYDKMIQDLARSYEISGGEHPESRTDSESLTYHLVIFGIKDGKMALLVPRSDDARYLGFQQSSDIWIGVLKNGTWTTVSKPVLHQR